MADYVIDSSSVLAYAFGESGAEIVVRIAADDKNQLLISSINMAEVLTKMIDKGIPIDEAVEILAPLTLEEISFGPVQARASAEFRNVTRRHGLSLGDRGCLALGLSQGVPVLTSDRKWSDIAGAIGAQIIVTRPEST